MGHKSSLYGNQFVFSRRDIFMEMFSFVLPFILQVKVKSSETKTMFWNYCLNKKKIIFLTETLF